MDLNLPSSVVLLTRLLAALTPSYIHPDEHFQGPQVIAALVFGWNVQQTWEFTADAPIRSVASLWAAYAPVMYPWKYVVGSNGSGIPLYFALRLWFCLLTYVFGTTTSRHTPVQATHPLFSGPFSSGYSRLCTTRSSRSLPPQFFLRLCCLPEPHILEFH